MEGGYLESCCYVTTRSGAVAGTFSFEQVLLSGYASDGGLYVPELLPKINRSEIKRWAGLTYPQLLVEILWLFISPDKISPTNSQVGRYI